MECDHVMMKMAIATALAIPACAYAQQQDSDPVAILMPRRTKYRSWKPHFA